MQFPVRKKAKAIWRAVPLLLFWAIWKERNRIIFEDATFSSRRLKLSVICSLFTRAVSFLRWISLLLDCFCIDSMAIPKVWSRWADLYVSSLLLASFCWS